MSLRSRALSIAGIAGSVGTMGSAFAYAYTHGSNTVNAMGSWLGLNELEWGRISVIIPVLLWAALLAFRLYVGERLERPFSIGYRLASAAMAMRVLSELPQFYINMRLEYQSPLGLGSWFGYLLSVLLLTVGMLLMGIGCRRSGITGIVGHAPLLIALLAIPTIAAGGFLAEISDDSTIFRVSAGILSIPQGVAWLWFSLVPLTRIDAKTVVNSF
jgi:hypothetical protein